MKASGQKMSLGEALVGQGEGCVAVVGGVQGLVDGPFPEVDGGVDVLEVLAVVEGLLGLGEEGLDGIWLRLRCGLLRELLGVVGLVAVGGGAGDERENKEEAGDSVSVHAVARYKGKSLRGGD